MITCINIEMVWTYRAQDFHAAARQGAADNVGILKDSSALRMPSILKPSEGRP